MATTAKRTTAPKRAPKKTAAPKATVENTNTQVDTIDTVNAQVDVADTAPEVAKEKKNSGDKYLDIARGWNISK